MQELSMHAVQEVYRLYLAIASEVTLSRYWSLYTHACYYLGSHDLQWLRNQITIVNLATWLAYVASPWLPSKLPYDSFSNVIAAVVEGWELNKLFVWNHVKIM